MKLYDEQIHFVGVVANKPICYVKNGKIMVEVTFDAIKWQEKNANLPLKATLVLSFLGRKMHEAKKCREGERVLIIGDKTSQWLDRNGDLNKVLHLSAEKILCLSDGIFENFSQKRIYLATAV